MKTSKKTKRLNPIRKKNRTRKVWKKLRPLKNVSAHEDLEQASGQSLLLKENTFEKELQFLQEELFGVIKEELNIRLAKLVGLKRKLQTQDKNKAEHLISHKTESLPIEQTIDERFLQKIHDLVIANLFDNNFGNGQLAHKMFLSQSQLYRKIKALTGKSVAIHIRSIRLHIGKELLESSQKTVSEIAYETGFTSPFYFSSTFSKEFGIAPSLMRDNVA